jgi:ferredoxin
MIGFAEIVDKIGRSGLAPRGALHLSAEERFQLRGRETRTLVLVGFVGARGWSAFERSIEAADGGADPLDRWSRRTIESLARDCGAEALFPFDGPPHWPFQRWAMRAEPVHASPLGLLIHPDFGLWHSYRGALAFVDEIAILLVDERPSPCEACAERPCLRACPVGAFAPGAYDLAGCAAHLRGPSGGDCMDGGCLARRACPIGADSQYAPSQTRFHMQAFVAGIGAGGGGLDHPASNSRTASSRSNR